MFSYLKTDDKAQVIQNLVRVWLSVYIKSTTTAGHYHLMYVLKLSMESLVFPRLTYALPVWRPAIHQDSLVRLNHFHNRALRITCGLRKLAIIVRTLAGFRIFIDTASHPLCHDGPIYWWGYTIQSPVTIWKTAYS